jgi:hypothetical protein
VRASLQQGGLFLRQDFPSFLSGNDFIFNSAINPIFLAKNAILPHVSRFENGKMGGVPFLPGNFNHARRKERRSLKTQKDPARPVRFDCDDPVKARLIINAQAIDIYIITSPGQHELHLIVYRAVNLPHNTRTAAVVPVKNQVY